MTGGERRISSLSQDFPTFDGSKKGNLVRVSNKLVYNNPSHIQVRRRQMPVSADACSEGQRVRTLTAALAPLQAGIETLLFALKKLGQLSTVPDAVILNMGIWVRDWTANGQDYKQRFETILQHGNYFINKTGGLRGPHWTQATLIIRTALREGAPTY